MCWEPVNVVQSDSKRELDGGLIVIVDQVMKLPPRDFERVFWREERS